MGRRARKRRRFSIRSLVLTILALRAFWQLVTAHPATSIVVGTLLSSAILLTLLTKWRLRRRAWLRQLAQLEEAGRYCAMNPAEFEVALATLCVRDGCVKVDVTGKAGDLGADVVAYSPGGAKVVLQAKRYASTNKVTGPDLQRFGGTCFTVHRADVAAVVTTSTFTSAAREYARLAGIHLIDETGLAAWASRTGPPPWHHVSARTSA